MSSGDVIKQFYARVPRSNCESLAMTGNEPGFLLVWSLTVRTKNRTARLTWRPRRTHHPESDIPAACAVLDPTSPGMIDRGRNEETLKKLLARAGDFCNEIPPPVLQELAAVHVLRRLSITNHAHNENREPVSIFPDQRYREF
jgi:hypothetical protein